MILSVSIAVTDTIDFPTSVREDDMRLQVSVVKHAEASTARRSGSKLAQKGYGYVLIHVGSSTRMRHH